MPEQKAPAISIVMAYHNRLDLLYFTLKTIELSSIKGDAEVVIVDDGSDISQRASLVLDKVNLNINLVDIDKKKKTWINPCIPFNIGANAAKGEILVIQSPECLHVGDVLLHAFSSVKNDNYVIYSCKWSTEEKTKELHKLQNVCGLRLKKAIRNIFSKGYLEGKHKWYNHPKYNPTMLHFTSAISKQSFLSVLQGFDERYANGFCFDDREFLARVLRSPLKIDMIPHASCFTIHQYHLPMGKKISNTDCRFLRNYELFMNVTLRSKDWKWKE